MMPVTGSMDSVQLGSTIVAVKLKSSDLGSVLLELGFNRWDDGVRVSLVNHVENQPLRVNDR
jgi:hypothetical protein